MIVALQVPAPAMERTNDAIVFKAAAPFRERRAPMRTEVVISLDRGFVGTHHHHRLIADVVRRVIADLGNFVESRGCLPDLLPQLFVFEARERWIGITAGARCRAPLCSSSAANPFRPLTMNSSWRFRAVQRSYNLLRNKGARTRAQPTMTALSDRAKGSSKCYGTGYQVRQHRGFPSAPAMRPPNTVKLPCCPEKNNPAHTGFCTRFVRFRPPGSYAASRVRGAPRLLCTAPSCRARKSSSARLPAQARNDLLSSAPPRADCITLVPSLTARPDMSPGLVHDHGDEIAGIIA